MKSDFIANVSHELKDAAFTDRMFGELVRPAGTKTNRTAREYGGISRVNQSGCRTSSTTCSTSRAGRGKPATTSPEGDLAEVVERALDVSRYRLDKEKMKLETSSTPSLPGLRNGRQRHDAGDS